MLLVSLQRNGSFPRSITETCSSVPFKGTAVSLVPLTETCCWVHFKEKCRFPRSPHRNMLLGSLQRNGRFPRSPKRNMLLGSHQRNGSFPRSPHRNILLSSLQKTAVSLVPLTETCSSVTSKKRQFPSFPSQKLDPRFT